MITESFLLNYNKPGPRYTSYPPANFFTDAFKSSDYVKQLKDSNTQDPNNISLYVHIPFCPQRCHFCGCNNIIGIGKSVIRQYVDALKVEIESVVKNLDLSRKVTQIHWGGGTPNSVSMDFIREIMDFFHSKFTFADFSEIAMECSPAYLEFNHIDQLAEMGFNRVSLGIQDFRPEVLEIVNRKPPKHPVEDIVKKLRESGFTGINLDLIYGLPLQTVDSFMESVEKAAKIGPDRLVTFSYAHVPWVKEYQKKLEDVGLPTPAEKLSMLVNSYKYLTENGYVSIGMDHYAKPDDELAVALVNKKLHRNFQGYCTRQTTGQVYGFGSSAITQLFGAYMQNVKGVHEYIDLIQQTGFATEKGYSLNREEQIRRDVINEIMCNCYLNFSDVAKRFNTDISDIQKVVDYNPAKLQEFIDDELLVIDGNKISVNEKGKMVVRNIAMAFDPALKTGEGVYSKTV